MSNEPDDAQIQELLEIYRQMSPEDQEAMTRMAQYLATMPEGSGLDASGIAALFEQFRNRH